MNIPQFRKRRPMVRVCKHPVVGMGVRAPVLTQGPWVAEWRGRGQETGPGWGSNIGTHSPGVFFCAV